MLPLALLHHRRQQHQPAALGLLQDQINHLANGLRRQHRVVGGATGLPHPGEQQAQIVVDFGDGPHRGAGIVGGGFLLYGNGGGQPFYMIHIGFFHHGQELPGVGGQGFHIAALAVGVDGVEGQGGFAGTGQAGDHHHLAPREIQIDVFQVVGSGPADADGVHEFFLRTRRNLLIWAQPANIESFSGANQNQFSSHTK